MIDFNLLQDFMEEAYEHLEEMESSLLRMEENPDDEDILNDIFRSVHTIKGAAQFVGIERISELTHKLENLLDRLRQRELAPSMEVVDLLIAGKDRMADLARELDQHKEERSPIDDLLVQIESIDAAEQTGATPDRKPESNAPAASAAAPDPSEFNDFLDDLTEELDREDPAALLQSESFDEEYDTELYAIFIDQLQESLLAIHRLEAELAGGGDAEAYLDRSEEAIRGMSSAANYMGYEKLTLFYSRWLENLASAREKLTVGSNVSSGVSSLWVQALVEKFPEAAPSDTVSPASEEIGGETADTMDLTDDEDMDAAIDDLFEELQSAGPSENPADLLTGEDFKEDYDDELFGIFHSQIADSTTSLRALDAELDRSEDPLGVLDRCVEIIETLSSAANYMGYDKLTGFYSRWNEVLSSAREQARSGSRVTGGINKPWVEALLDKFSIAAAAAAPPERQEEQPTDATSEAERTNPELASAMTLLQEETIDEEQDAELFEIFMSQLKDGIAELHRLQDELSGSSDPEKPLEACGEILQRLQLAANYMGYDHLSGFYAHWQKVLASAAGQGSTGTGVLDDILLPWTHALAEKFSVPSPVPTDETASYRDSAVGDLIGDLFQETSEQDLDDLLQAEDLEEEYDAELFGIFQEQLIEGVDNLQRLTAQLVGTDDIDTVLLECSRILERMSSSANYMGYDKLMDFYGLWQEKIDSARSLLQSGEEIPFDINDVWMDALLKRFPEAKPEDSAGAKTPLDAETLPEEAVGAAHDPTGETATTEEDALFRRLSMAFDSDQAQVPPDSDGAIDDVIQEMLSVGNGKLPAFETALGAVTPGEAVEDLHVPAAPPVEEEVVAPSVPEPSAANRAETAETPWPKVETPAAGAETPATSEKPPLVEEGGRSSERIVRQSIRVDADKIDYLMNEVGELVVSRAYFFQLFNEMRLLQQEFKETLGLDQKELKPLRELTFRLGEASVALGRVSNELQEGVMKVRMLPVSQLFNRYPRLVRDLVHHTDKKVTLEVRGEETELDKMIIEEISDPLIHLIRNAVDHGIEPAAEREATGKYPEGHLLLEAYHESNHIVIEISDDGRGVSPAKIRQKALEKGLYSAEELERMANNELFQIIMLPGFSTASVATKTSGRGVGMDVVKKNIEKLNGTFEVESEVGKGTMMRIKIPLTLAIIQALMVKVGQDLFTIPLPAVEETLKISKDEITTIEGVEVIHIRETTMPIFRLRSLFAMSEQNDFGNESFVVIVNAGSQSVGLVVDQLMGQDEVVIKPIADYLREESGFSGATIIGDGKVSLILDVHDIVKLAAKRNTLRRRTLRKFGRMQVAEAQHG